MMFSWSYSWCRSWQWWRFLTYSQMYRCISSPLSRALNNSRRMEVSCAVFRESNLIHCLMTAICRPIVSLHFSFTRLKDEWWSSMDISYGSPTENMPDAQQSKLYDTREAVREARTRRPTAPSAPFRTSVPRTLTASTDMAILLSCFGHRCISIWSEHLTPPISQYHSSVLSSSFSQWVVNFKPICGRLLNSAVV
jgi:hypothetical protein